MKKNDPQDNKKDEYQGPVKTSKFRAVLSNLFPFLIARIFTKESGGKQKELEAIRALFWQGFMQSRKINLFPTGGSDGRSLVLTIDKKIFLKFEQNYQNFELADFGFGDYPNDSDHTIFDKLNE